MHINDLEMMLCFYKLIYVCLGLCSVSSKVTHFPLTNEGWPSWNEEGDFFFIETATCWFLVNIINFG